MPVSVTTRTFCHHDAIQVLGCQVDGCIKKSMTGIKGDTMILLMVNVVSAVESHLLKSLQKEPYSRYQMLIISFPTPLELDYIILQIPFKSQRNSPLERRIFLSKTAQASLL